MILKSHRQAKTALIVLAAYWLTLCAATHVPNDTVKLPNNLDKLVHFMVYGLLAFLLARVVSRRWALNGLTFTLLLTVLVCYGTVDELSQIYVPYRRCDVMDWLGNMLGSFSGLTAFWLASGSLSDWNRAEARA